MKASANLQRKLESRLGADPYLVDIGRYLSQLECWVVGGWVRDHAVNRHPTDLDLVVPGSENAYQAAHELGARWNATPRLLGKPEKAVWRLTGPRGKVEIWPIEGDDLISDAMRRDFSCNALFWRLPDGPLIDPTGGIDDIACRQIRAISKANILADPVRLLRGVRLIATLDDFSFNPDTSSLIADLAPNLAEAPRERVGAELVALAQAPRPMLGFREGSALGLLGPSGPGSASMTVPFNARVEDLAVIIGEDRHPVQASVTHNRSQAILAWLASGWPLGGSSKELSAFAWPRDLAVAIATAVSLHHEACSVVNQNPADRRQFIARCGDVFPTVLALAAATDSTESNRPKSWQRFWRQWVRSGESILNPPSLLDAFEVTAVTGVGPGPQLGRILVDLKRATIRREIRSPNGARQWLGLRDHIKTRQ